MTTQYRKLIDIHYAITPQGVIAVSPMGVDHIKEMPKIIKTQPSSLGEWTAMLYKIRARKL